MPSIIRKTVRNVKRRIRVGLQEGRTHELYSAACRLLTRHDYDRVSVAKLAKEAGCSVGSFYNRFRDKPAFLYFVIRSGFRSSTDAANRELASSQTARRAGLEKMVRQIVRHVVERVGHDRMTGITRATVKLAATNPDVREPMLEYRRAVTDHALRMLGPYVHGRAAAERIQIAMQLLFAVTTDAALQHVGPLRPGGTRMSALSRRNSASSSPTETLAPPISSAKRLSMVCKCRGREIFGVSDIGCSDWFLAARA